MSRTNEDTVALLAEEETALGSDPHSHSSGSRSDIDPSMPTSVRGAPPELRRLIRKRQNSESAKRCRQRKKLEDSRAADEIASQAARLRRLEGIVGSLMTRVDATQGALATLCTRVGIPTRCALCAGAGCETCTPGHAAQAAHASHAVHAAHAAHAAQAAQAVQAAQAAHAAHAAHVGSYSLTPSSSPLPYSPQSVQGATIPQATARDASALAAKVDELADSAWN